MNHLTAAHVAIGAPPCPGCETRDMYLNYSEKRIQGLKQEAAERDRRIEELYKAIAGLLERLNNRPQAPEPGTFSPPPGIFREMK